MEDDTEKWDPSKSPDAKWLIHPDAVRQKDTAYVTLDIGYFKDNVTPAWVVTCSHYSGQLRDFSNFTNGSVAGSLYHFPVTEYAAETLIKYFHARPTLEALKLVPHICPDVFGKKLGASISASIFKQIESTSILADLPIPLFPFQVEGILKMTYYKGRALLADEMGLGKTIQSLGFWLYNKIGKTLIICPRSVKLNWQSEIFQWLRNIRQEDVVIIDTLMKTLPEDKIFYVINYDIIDKWRNELKSLQFELLLVDEAHYIKSSKANRTKAVLDVAAGIGYVLALTGTPVINRGIEIFNLFTLLAPGVFPKRGKFVSAFTNDRKNILNGPGNAEDIERTVKETADSNFSGITNRELLGDVLRETILIRRTKKEVLPDLPEKIRTMIPIECDDKHYKMYKQSEEEFKIMLSECGMSIGDFLKGLRLNNPTDQIRALAALEKARQAAAAAKLNMAIEWINNTFENIDKLVIFAHHKFVIDRLVAEFPNMSVFITGEVVEKDRQSAIDNFYKNDQIKLMIVSIMAGGVGINFTVASNVVFLETGWSPAINDQAEDRVHRIGQTGVVNIYHLVGKDTIDMPIYDLVYSKKNMIDQVHKKNQQDGGKTLDEIVASLNTHLNPLGLRVSFDRNLMDDTLCLHQPEWFTLKEAIEFAHKQESKILKTNLMDDIKKGLFAANEIRWITQVGGRGGYWLITKPAIQRRIEERRRGRGRPKKVIGDNPLI